MKKSIFIFLLLTLHGLITDAQNIRTLQTKTWYCSCDFSTDSLILSPENKAGFNWEIKLLPDGRVTLKNLKQNTSSSAYSYSIKNQSIRLFYETKDSLMNLNYSFGRHYNKGDYKLSTFHAMRYKKHKNNDLPPSDHFTLIKGNKKKEFHSLNEITVHRMKKGLKHDSIEYICKGEFLELRADTLLINAYQFSEHNFYKKFPDSLHYFSEFLFDSLIKLKVPVKEITTIYSQRDKFSSLVNGAAFVAMGGFVVSFPLALSVKSEPMNTVFTRTAVFSALSIPVIISFNIIFSKKKFQLAPTLKNKNTWQFESKSPGVPIKK